eukprot:SAG22_NODE_11806_length_468_cov_1.162602_2_plen_46_part_01
MDVLWNTLDLSVQSFPNSYKPKLLVRVLICCSGFSAAAHSATSVTS